MYWERLGTVSFQKLYSDMIDRFDHAVFVEIGVWIGASALYMGEKIKDSGKDIKFYVVDTFEGGPDYASDPIVVNKAQLQTFKDNIEPVKDYVNIVVGDSALVHDQFEDESIDFIFIDADHSFEAVMKDITAWLPKVKYGGVISGHDYNQPTCGVKRAVDAYFGPAAKEYDGGCWIFEK